MSNINAMDSKENIDDSESIASDESEEMTEVDESECDIRRATCVADLKLHEIQFAKLKEELIYERNNLINKKLQEIENESAEEFVVPLRKLQQNMDHKIKLATLTRDYRYQNIEHIYECEKESSRLTLENDMQSLLDKYKSIIENEIRQMEENRRQYLLDYNLHQNQLQKQSNTTNETNDISEVCTSQEIINNDCDSTIHSIQSSYNGDDDMPPIVYELQDYEILEDWSVIKMYNDLNRTVSTEC